MVHVILGVAHKNRILWPGTRLENADLQVREGQAVVDQRCVDLEQKIIYDQDPSEESIQGQLSGVSRFCKILELSGQ